MPEKKISKRPSGHKATKRSAAEPGTALSPSALGNRTLSRLLSSGSARISQPGDPQEKEADRMAEAATASPGLHPGQEGAALPSLHPPSTLSGIGPGRPLDPEARAMLEPRFGRDLGAVRVHDGPEAAEAARAAEARAFTVGKDVVFSPGQYAPGTPAGQRLLAHELAHVVQQFSAVGPPVVQRSPFDVKPPASQGEEAAAPIRPEIVEIRPEEPITSQNPKIAMIAGQAKASLRLSLAGVIQVDVFWDLSSNPEVQGPEVRSADARKRAEQTKAALVKLGVPESAIATGTLSSQLLSDPKGSPGGLVRISHYPTGRPSALLPPVPPPRIPRGLSPALTPPLVPKASPPTPGSPPPSTSPKFPGEEEKSRTGSGGDLAKAVLALPPVKKAVEEAKEQALQAWKNLSLGGKLAVATGVVSIAAGAIGSLAANPEAAKEVLKKLDGVEIPLPIPRVPGEFKIQILYKDEPPKFDPHASSPPTKPGEISGQGAMLKWELKF